MDKDFLFQALNSPFRREILRMLEEGDLSAGEIWGRFPVSQPSISRHLDILRRAGLIVSRRQANLVIYSLDRAAARQAALWLSEVFPT